MSDFVPLYNESPTTTTASVTPAPFTAVTAASPTTAAETSDTSLSAPMPPVSAISNSDTCLDAPQVTLVRENDQVVRILVQCSCGRTTELDCVY